MKEPSPHLTDDMIQRFRARKLSPAELLAADDHLSDCPECGERIAGPARLQQAVALLSGAGQPTAQEAHLDYASLEALAAGTLGGVALERAQEHLNRCARCSAELNDLRAVQAELASGHALGEPALEKPPPAAVVTDRRRVQPWYATLLRPPRNWAGSPAFGLALTACLILALVQDRSVRVQLGRRTAELANRQSEVDRAKREAADAAGRLRAAAATQAALAAQNAALARAAQQRATQGAARIATLESQRHQLQQQLQQAGSGARAGQHPPSETHPTSGAPSAPPVLLNDGSRQIAVRGERYVLLTPLPAPLDEVLSGKSLRAPASLRALRGEAPLARGGVSVFHALSPVGTAVRDLRPTFRWTPVAGADGYIVSLSDLTTGDSVESPPIAGASSQIARPLLPGHRYQWQVRAMRQGNAIATAPVAPDPVARFEELDPSRLDTLERALAAAHGSPLERGVALVQAGLLDEAAREFAKLAQANPGSPVVKRLQDELRAVRGT